jgi:hypothetical protein
MKLNSQVRSLSLGQKTGRTEKVLMKERLTLLLASLSSPPSVRFPVRVKLVLSAPVPA